MADQYLRDDMGLYARIVERIMEITLNDNQFGALVIFCAHAGPLAFETAPFIRLLNLGWYEQVPASLRKWSIGKRLTEKSRRAVEIEIWNTPVNGYED